jgi:hypothetical protein
MRRRISLFSRSCGLFDQICFQCAKGNNVNAKISGPASESISAAAGNRSSSCSTTRWNWAQTASASGCMKIERTSVATNGPADFGTFVRGADDSGERPVAEAIGVQGQLLLKVPSRIRVRDRLNGHPSYPDLFPWAGIGVR